MLQLMPARVDTVAFQQRIPGELSQHKLNLCWNNASSASHHSKRLKTHRFFLFHRLSELLHLHPSSYITTAPSANLSVAVLKEGISFVGTRSRFATDCYLSNVLLLNWQPR